VSDSERKTSSNQTAQPNLPDFGEEEASDGGFAPLERGSDQSGPDVGHEETSAWGDFGRVKRKPNRSTSDFLSKAGKRGGGGKLSRTETVTVRLDPKLRYLAELAARKQRRTLSSFVEWAIEENLKTVHLSEDESESIANMAAFLWDVDEPDRFVRLALLYPDMLTHDEQVLWKLIIENGYLWKGKRDKEGEWTWSMRADDLIIERLREYWNGFKMVAYEDADKAVLPTWLKKEQTPILTEQ
jgi:hypothetical protein